jgi:hypothetical protein
MMCSLMLRLWGTGAYSLRKDLCDEWDERLGDRAALGVIGREARGLDAQSDDVSPA